MQRAKRPQRRVLVVDDDWAMRKLCLDALTGAGLSVETASNGEDALDRLSYSEYDLVVSDIEMPFLDGVGLYNRILEEHSYLKDRFIFMTGNLRPDARKTIESRNLEYLSKPFSITELISRVDSVVTSTLPYDTDQALENRRRDRRVCWQGDCFITEDAFYSPVFSRSEDISRNGLRIKYLGKPLETESALKVYLKLLRIETVARIVWSKALDTGESVSGLMFSEPLSQSSMMLLSGADI